MPKYRLVIMWFQKKKSRGEATKERKEKSTLKKEKRKKNKTIKINQRKRRNPKTGKGV